MTQTWHDLLFAHWPYPSERLRRLVPEPLEVDTFEGEGWVGIIPFRLSGVRLRGLPEVPLTSNFREINVRTYVRLGDKRGVLFLSLDADSPLVVALARPWFLLPYMRAGIRMSNEAGCVSFKCLRTDPVAPEAEFSATYCPCAAPCAAKEGTLASWLTERYCYYAQGRWGDLYRCDIAHPRWPLQEAEAHIETNTMALPHGINLPAQEPLLHFSKRITALVWPLRRVRNDECGVRNNQWELPALRTPHSAL